MTLLRARDALAAERRTKNLLLELHRAGLVQNESGMVTMPSDSDSLERESMELKVEQAKAAVERANICVLRELLFAFERHKRRSHAAAAAADPRAALASAHEFKE